MLQYTNKTNSLNNHDDKYSLKDIPKLSDSTNDIKISQTDITKHKINNNVNNKHNNNDNNNDIQTLANIVMASESHNDNILIPTHTPKHNKHIQHIQHFCSKRNIFLVRAPSQPDSSLRP